MLGTRDDLELASRLDQRCHLSALDRRRIGGRDRGHRFLPGLAGSTGCETRSKGFQDRKPRPDTAKADPAPEPEVVNETPTPTDPRESALISALPRLRIPTVQEVARLRIGTGDPYSSEVPILAGSGVDPRWMLQQPPPISDHQRAIWHARATSSTSVAGWSRSLGGWPSCGRSHRSGSGSLRGPGAVVNA